MVDTKADAAWETGTWEGSRRAQLRATLTMTVRERLEALEDLAELARRLAAMPRTEAPITKPDRDGPTKGQKVP